MKALYNISYGVYILTAKTDKFNGCVINTLMQVTSNPNRVSITINKDNHTTKMIEQSRNFNVSILDVTTDFDIIKRFGFSSGANVDKFDKFKDYKIADNGIPYITKNTNSYISAKVVSKTDLGTHINFVADLTADVVLSNVEPMTYAYYLKNVKPKPETKNKKVYVCRICGYVYEGDELPKDFICPICKHGVEAFECKEENKVGNKNIKAVPKKHEKLTKRYYCPSCGNLEENNIDNGKCRICGEVLREVQVDL